LAPQGNNRIEIQVPLASKEAREKRETFEKALDSLQSQNVNLAIIVRSLGRPAEQRKPSSKNLPAIQKTS